ncbi:hypothetical protein HAX54_013291 [Datura stramonium]|uniref:Uncharacterized protein n=1 Tax=Datura stramonium TaxID=4076 RepID=A0ABS8Y5I7_DATST|nr:hypothetical protein [Datura stramonium]
MHHKARTETSRPQRKQRFSECYAGEKKNEEGKACLWVLLVCGEGLEVKVGGAVLVGDGDMADGGFATSLRGCSVKAEGESRVLLFVVVVAWFLPKVMEGMVTATGGSLVAVRRRRGWGGALVMEIMVVGVYRVLMVSAAMVDVVWNLFGDDSMKGGGRERSVIVRRVLVEVRPEKCRGKERGEKRAQPARPSASREERE